MLAFPANFARARRNSADLFADLIGLEVTGAEPVPYDRSFYLHLGPEIKLLFKMHGNRSNIVVFKNGLAADVFNHHLKSDLSLDTEALPGKAPDFEQLKALDCNPSKAVPSIGPLGKTWLERNGYAALPTAEEKWDLLQSLLRMAENPAYYITEIEGKKRLSLFPLEPVTEVLATPIEALNRFSSVANRVNYLESERAAALRNIQRRALRTKAWLAKTEEKLNELEAERPLNETADLLMANLHAIPAGASEAEVLDFYTGEPITIKLKPNVTPQKRAEELYRKAKNRKLETDRLYQNLEQRQSLLESLADTEKQVADTTDLRVLRTLLKEKGLQIELAEEAVDSLPYKSEIFMGFEIRVGRNAKANDLLTFKFAHKEDLWLHARDTPGSHVIIKFKAGQTFPGPVIERAAQLAAHYSKRKNEGLCPVIVTPRKFIRKAKGGIAGRVILERETVVMVKPAAEGIAAVD